MQAINLSQIELRVLFRIVYAAQWDAEKRIRHAHSHGDAFYSEPERDHYASLIDKLHAAALRETQ